MRERTGPMAAEQGRSIPAQLGRAPGPIFTPGQEIVAVAQKLAPSVRWDVGEWAMVVEARDPVDPTGRNATCSHIGRDFFWIKSFRIGVLDRYGLRDGRSRPPFQPPEPFTPIPKSVPNGFYAKKLLGSFEHFRMRDALAFAEQSCRSGPSLKFRHAQGTQCERISQKFNHEVFGATMEHGLPLSTGFESFHGWIATLPKRGIDPLHYDVVDFAALVKGRFAQSLMNSVGQVKAGMEDVRPEPAATGLRG